MNGQSTTHAEVLAAPEQKALSPLVPQPQPVQHCDSHCNPNLPIIPQVV